MNISNSQFAYGLTIKLSSLEEHTVAGALPGISDLALSSRKFDTYHDCIQSAKALVDDLISGHNSHSSVQLKVSTEVNPALGGQANRSTDWGDDELARLWVFDGAAEGAVKIDAVGQVSVFSVERTTEQVRH